MTNPVGRPSIAPELRKTHKKLAIYPTTKEKVKRIALKNNIQIVDLIDNLINGAYDEEGNRRRARG